MEYRYCKNCQQINSVPDTDTCKTCSRKQTGRQWRRHWETQKIRRNDENQNKKEATA